MKTTVALDDDVVAALERLRISRNAGLERILNEVLRAGLEQIAHWPCRKPPYATRAVDLGRLRVGSFDNVADILAVGEGEACK